MCGIAGIIHLDKRPVSFVVLKRMCDAIQHRGPDDEGQWIEGNVGLGHRRLSIIDISSAGHQPMIGANGRYVMSYNGEVYNFRELRSELEAIGYIFHSQTDSEVILNALIEWGAEAIARFNGMFAFAFWDSKEQILLLARDRYGVKPLYYAKQNNAFLFGSEQKAMLASSLLEKKLNKPALLEYMTFQNLLTDQTLLEDIRIVPPGNFIVLDSNSGDLQSTRYWDFHFTEPEQPLSRDAYLEELNHLFTQAVQRQLVGDVELGAYLSGGMDSGSITAIAAQNFPNLKSFTCGFDLSSANGIELGFDERYKAESMSAIFKTEHYEIVLKSGDMERCLPQLAWHLEEPRIGQSYPNFYAAKLASKFVKVVLSGTGGDELFAGYPWRYYRSVGHQGFEDYIDHYYDYWQRLVSNEDLKKIFAPIWDDVKQVWTRDIFRDVFLNHDNELNKPEDYINHSLYFEAKTFMHGLLVMEDKLSMAHGLESRVPFLDNNLVDFAMRCPLHLKLNNLSDTLRINENEAGRKPSRYFQQTNDGKQILRDVMRRHIPDKVTKETKQGFSAPDASWFKGDSIDFVKHNIGSKKSKLYDILDYPTVMGLVNEHLEGKQNRRLLIWSLLSLEQWLLSYLDLEI